MKHEIFKPEDFNSAIGVQIYKATEVVANIANKKLNELIESWPVVYFENATSRIRHCSEKEAQTDTHKARLAFIEEIVKEPCKHESIIKGLKFELESTKKVYQMNREYVESVKNKIATLKEVNKDLVNAVNGLCSGEDWNNGTHAKIYRPKVIEAIEQIKIKLGHI